MEQQRLPYLDVHGPDGQRFSVELATQRVTIGRFRELNEVGLEPDPQQLVGRKAHCLLERDAEGWWVVDTDSVNGTFIRRGENKEAVMGRSQIVDGEVILILGRLEENETPRYWELTFCDPLRTQRAQPKLRLVYLDYDPVQARLFRVDGPERREIDTLRPQEHKLIRFMAQRNRTNGNVPVMCAYDELIEAVWGKDAAHTETDVNHLVWELRKKIELNPNEPQFLQTVRGLGYRLVTRPTAGR